MLCTTINALNCENEAWKIGSHIQNGCRSIENTADRKRKKKSLLLSTGSECYYVDLHTYTYSIYSAFLFWFIPIVRNWSFHWICNLYAINGLLNYSMCFSRSLPFPFFFFAASAAQRDSPSSKDNNPGAYGSKQNALDLDAFKVGPYFDRAASKNVTALLGKTCYLNCRIKNLTNKTVSALHIHSMQLWEYISNAYCTLTNERN